MGPTVLVYARGAEPYAAALRCAEPELEVRTAADPASARPLLADTEVVLAWRMPAELYALAPRLGWVQCMGAGV